MRVIVYPGTPNECEKELSTVMSPKDVFNSGTPARLAVGNLIELLVERGVLTLEDCTDLGGPVMERKE
jgi:hypothetical protein